jgi:hypothetical protein
LCEQAASYLRILFIFRAFEIVELLETRVQVSVLVQASERIPGTEEIKVDIQDERVVLTSYVLTEHLAHLLEIVLL